MRRTRERVGRAPIGFRLTATAQDGSTPVEPPAAASTVALPSAPSAPAEQAPEKEARARKRGERDRKAADRNARRRAAYAAEKEKDAPTPAASSAAPAAPLEPAAPAPELQLTHEQAAKAMQSIWGVADKAIVGLTKDKSLALTKAEMAEMGEAWAPVMQLYLPAFLASPIGIALIVTGGIYGPKLALSAPTEGADAPPPPSA